jgi:hypothetical protein
MAYSSQGLQIVLPSLGFEDADDGRNAEEEAHQDNECKCGRHIASPLRGYDHRRKATFRPIYQ